MITRLELRRWRSFDHVAIDLLPGTTFVVAPNGVGKTSLLMGLSWALFGEHSHIDAAACVRLGYSDAEANVVLQLVDGRHLTIARTITIAGRSTVGYDFDGNTVPEYDALSLLADEFGAPVEVAARLAVIRGPGKDSGELQLREHLYDAFGVSGLRQASAVAAKLHREAVSARKKLRSASATQLKDRAQLEAAAAGFRRELDNLTMRRAPLIEALDAAFDSRHVQSAWNAYDQSAAERSTAIDDILRSAAPLGFPARSLEELAQSISRAQVAGRLSIEDAQRREAAAQVQMLAAQSALALLEDHDPSCPTCARPFHGDELQRAISAQWHSLTLAQEQIAAAAATTKQLDESDRSLAELFASVHALSQPLLEPSQPRPPADPDVAIASAQQALRDLDQLAGSVSAELSALKGQLDNDDAVQAAFAAEKLAWQREALTQAASMALLETAQRLAQEYIEPLSQQVRWRWKALFGEDGLQLRPDGSIVRVVEDRELPWHQLSSGEQIWARLVASLLVLRSSTSLPFAWLDEPLEHLDPRARRIVATDLATTTRSGRPRQMIVTTSEHTLARQLAQDLPDTHLRQINRSEPVALLPRRNDPAPHGRRLNPSA